MTFKRSSFPRADLARDAGDRKQEASYLTRYLSARKELGLREGDLHPPERDEYNELEKP